MLYFTLDKSPLFNLRYSISQWGRSPNGIQTSFAIICLIGKFHLTSYTFVYLKCFYMHLHVFVGGD